MASKKTKKIPVVKTARAVTRETKRDVKQIGRGIKATKKAFKQVAKLFGSKSGSGKKTGSKGSKPKTPPIHQSKASASKKSSGKSSTTKKSTPAKSKKRSPKSGKSKYTLQELASSKSKNLGRLFSDIEKHASEIDALKSDNQMFAFEIAIDGSKRHSLVPFYSIESVISFLANSAGIAEAERNIGPLYSSISILTEGEATETPETNEQTFHREVKERQEALRKENAEAIAEAVNILGVKPSAGKNKYEVVKGLVRKQKESDSIIDGLLARILELENKNAPKKKKAKKSSKKTKSSKTNVPKKNSSNRKTTKRGSKSGSGSSNAVKSSNHKTVTKSKSTKETKKNANRKNANAGRTKDAGKAKSKAAERRTGKSGAKKATSKKNRR